MSSINRREFVVVAGVCACSAAGFARQPAERRPPASGPTAKPVDLGVLKQFDHDGVFDQWRQSGRFLVVRHEGKLYAVSARCTHKGGLLRVEEDQIVCPMHGSRFDAQGIPTSGPAKAPLFRLSIKVTDADHVIVDPGKHFVEADWEQAEAFVEIKA